MPKVWQKVRPNEAIARATNATDWQPLSGMVKQRCSQCRYFFAVLVAEAEATARCPDCTGRSVLSVGAVKPAVQLPADPEVWQHLLAHRHLFAASRIASSPRPAPLGGERAEATQFNAIAASQRAGDLIEYRHDELDIFLPQMRVAGGEFRNEFRFGHPTLRGAATSSPCLRQLRSCSAPTASALASDPRRAAARGGWASSWRWCGRTPAPVGCP
jgi:hypothetical protein